MTTTVLTFCLHYFYIDFLRGNFVVLLYLFMFKQKSNLILHKTIQILSLTNENKLSIKINQKWTKEWNSGNNDYKSWEWLAHFWTSWAWLRTESWSSGYGRRLVFWKSWVWIPVLYIGWTINCCKNCIGVYLKISEKEARDGDPLFLKKETENCFSLRM